MPARWILLGALLGALVATPGAALQSDGGVQISPARVERDLKARQVSVKLLVVNRERAPRRVTLITTGLAHDLDGAPQLLDPSPAAPSLQLEGDPELTLDAGERRELRLRAAIPAGTPSLYAGLVARFRPLTAPAEAEVRTSVFLLRAPRPWKEQITVSDSGLLPSQKGKPLRVYADVRNTGNVHVNPRGRMRVLLDGDEIASVALSGGTVLPGYARRFTGTWTPGDVPGSGRVTLQPTFVNPPGSAARAIDLATAGPGEPAARIPVLHAAVDPSGAVVTMALENIGRVTISPVITLTARAGSTERSRVVMPLASLKVGESRDVEWRPKVGAGIYEIRARAALGKRLLDEKVAAVGLGLKEPPAQKRSSLPLIVAMLGALLLAGGIVMLAALRRRSGGRGPGGLRGQLSHPVD